MKKFLIIDDHSMFSDGLKMLLTAMQKELIAIACESPAQAINEHSDFSPDLILLDHCLGSGNGEGIDAMEMIKKAFEEAPILIVSGDHPRRHAKNYLAAGAAGYICKSANSKILISAIDIVLSGGTYLPYEAISGEEKSVLSKRQRDILLLVIEGHSNKEIAYRLSIAEGTVKAHLFAAYKALDVNSRASAIRMLRENEYLVI